jgi:hypothetical protein
MRKLITLCLAALAFCFGLPRAFAEDIDDQVYMLIAKGCQASAKAFVQTAFRTTVEGQTGLVTALHGVVGCTIHTAQRDEGRVYIDDLRLTKVDIDRDVAFFVSDKLAADKTPALQGAPRSNRGELKVVGYPDAAARQFSQPSPLHEQPYSSLRSSLPATLLDRLEKRRSPSVDIGVLWVQAAVTAGYSGAPMLTVPSRQVMGVTDGGLGGGFAHVNWIIPFSEIRWMNPSQAARQLEELGRADTSLLFASAYETQESVPNVTTRGAGATITGRILYAGRPAVALSKRSDAVIELMEVSSRQRVPADVKYNPATGEFQIRDVPPGKFTPFVRLETGYPFYTESGGDFFSRLSGLNEDIVVSPYEEALTRDLQVVHVVRLTKPVDNQAVRTSTTDPPETLYQSFYAPSAEVFAWDPVPGAAYYEAWILLQDRGTGRRLDTKSYRLTTPILSPQLAVTPKDAHYMFSVNAYDSAGRLIGVFQNYFRNGSGGWFEFSVLPGRAVQQTAPSVPLVTPKILIPSVMSVPPGPPVITAAAVPPIVTIGQPTTISITARTRDKQPISGAKVVLSAGGGTFAQVGQTRIEGVTDANGVFRTEWLCKPCAPAYGISVEVTGPQSRPVTTTVEVKTR